MATRARKPSLLFRRGVEALQGNDVAAAIGLLTKAAERDPDAPHGRLQLGVALQAAGRHDEAIACFRTAQASLAEDPAPFLHAAVSHLVLGDHHAALIAASEACHRAPELATAHYAYGEAWAASGEPARAEQA